MATITLKNVPDELLDALRRRAESNRRSLNSEAIVCLRQAVLDAPAPAPAPVRPGGAMVLREPAAAYGETVRRPTLAEIRALRATLAVPPLTDDFLERAIEEGRA